MIRRGGIVRKKRTKVDLTGVCLRGIVDTPLVQHLHKELLPLQNRQELVFFSFPMLLPWLFSSVEALSLPPTHLFFFILFFSLIIWNTGLNELF